MNESVKNEGLRNEGRDLFETSNGYILIYMY